MPLLLMDVESVVSIQNQMISDVQTIKETTNSINSQIGLMVGSTWIAPGADKFLVDFHNWSAQIQNLVIVIEQVTQKLGQEIEEWQQEAASY